MCGELPDKLFDLVIIDESAQATEPNTWVPLQLAKKVVFAGDHKQLEPVIKSAKASKMGLATTLFEQIMEQFPEVSKILKIQHRMNMNIMNWSSWTMYENQLKAADEVRNHLLGDSKHYQIPEDSKDEDYGMFLNNSLLYIDSNTGIQQEASDKKTGSKYNISEVQLVTVIVNKLRKLGIKDTDIGIITPYKAQTDRVKMQLHDKKV